MSEQEKTDYFVWRHKKSDIFFAIFQVGLMTINFFGMIFYPSELEIYYPMLIMLFNLIGLIIIIGSTKLKLKKEYVYKDILEGGEEE